MGEVLDQSEIDALLEAAAAGGPAAPGEDGKAPAAPPQRGEAEKLTVVEARPGDRFRNLEMLIRLPVKVDVRIGQATLPAREVLALGKGSSVLLEQSVNDSAEVLVNGKVVALGEMVAVEGVFGVRITKVMNAAERLEALS